MNEGWRPGTEEGYRALRREQNDPSNKLRKKLASGRTVVEGSYVYGIYLQGAHGNLGYFSQGSDSFGTIVSFEEAQKNLAGLKAAHNNAPVVVLDIMGQGVVGRDLGADIPMGWTLFDHELGAETGGIEMMYGDLFDRTIACEHMQALESLLQARGAILGAVFFRAIAGYISKKDNIYANAFLYERYLRPLYERVPVGALLYLNINFPTSYGEQLITILEQEGFRISRSPEGMATRRCVVLEKTTEKLVLPKGTSVLEKMFLIEKV